MGEREPGPEEARSAEDTAAACPKRPRATQRVTRRRVAAATATAAATAAGTAAGTAAASSPRTPLPLRWAKGLSARPASAARAAARGARESAQARGAQPEPGPDAPFLANAYIQRTTDRGATVRVTATAPVTAVVCVSPAGSGGDRCERRITRARPRRNHAIAVRGLLPDASYAYRVTAAAPEAARGEHRPGPERPSKAPGIIKESVLRSAPADPGGEAVRIEAGPQVTALATVAGARWATNVYGNGRLDYEAQPEAALDPLLLDQQFELPRYASRKLPDALTADHRVCIGPLEPETVYGYTVTSVAGSTPASSPQRRFATLAADGAPAGDFAAGRRYPLDLKADGLVALPNGNALLWSRAGEALVARFAASGLADRGRWSENAAIGGAAAAADGRIFLSLAGPGNAAGLLTAIVRVYRPDASSPTGYAAAADLGPLIGAPGALAVDSFGNLAALTTLTGDDGIPEAQFNLFDADPAAPGGFTLRFALWPFGQATAMACTTGGSILLLAAGRAIVALAGDIHNPDGAVTVWDGRNAGKGPWIEAAAISGGPGGVLHLVDACTGALQAVAVDPVSGAFAAAAAGNTRDLPGGLEGAPAALAVDVNGAALVLERGAGGVRTVAQFRRAGGGAPSASAAAGPGAGAGATRAGEPLDPRRWRPQDRDARVGRDGRGGEMSTV